MRLRNPRATLAKSLWESDPFAHDEQRGINARYHWDVGGILPDGFYSERGSFRADDRIDEGVAENEAEVHAIFDANAGRVQRVRCAYCRAQTQTTRRAGLAWFTGHVCVQADARVAEAA